MSRRSRLYGRPCLCWGVPPVPISVPENKTQAAAIAGVSRKIKLIVSYAFSVILLVGSGGATYSPVLKCTIIVKNSIPPRLTFFPSHTLTSALTGNLLVLSTVRPAWGYLTPPPCPTNTSFGNPNIVGDKPCPKPFPDHHLLPLSDHNLTPNLEYRPASHHRTRAVTPHPSCHVTYHRAEVWAMGATTPSRPRSSP